jgi:hypothetical protein
MKMYRFKLVVESENLIEIMKFLKEFSPVSDLDMGNDFKTIYESKASSGLSGDDYIVDFNWEATAFDVDNNDLESNEIVVDEKEFYNTLSGGGI